MAENEIETHFHYDVDRHQQQRNNVLAQMMSAAGKMPQLQTSEMLNENIANVDGDLGDKGDEKHFFEGVEKLLEIWFEPRKDADLRKVPR